MSKLRRLIQLIVARSRSAPHREVVRVRALLMAADGLEHGYRAGVVDVAGVRHQMARPVRRGGAHQVAQVCEGQGRKTTIPQERIDEIVDLTLNYRPEGETHWSCRTVAAASGVEIDCAASVVGTGPLKHTRSGR